MNLDKIISESIRKTLKEGYLEKGMELIGECEVSEELQYHLENKISLRENIFDVYSEPYLDLINEVRELYRIRPRKIQENRERYNQIREAI